MGSLCRNFHLCRNVKLREAAAEPVALPPIVSAAAAAASPVPPTAAGSTAVVAAPVTVRGASQQLRESDEFRCLPTVLDMTPTPPQSSKGRNDTSSNRVSATNEAAAAVAAAAPSSACITRFARRWHHDDSTASVATSRLIATPPRRPKNVTSSSCASSSELSMIHQKSPVTASCLERIHSLLSKIHPLTPPMPFSATAVEEDCVMIAGDGESEQQQLTASLPHAPREVPAAMPFNRSEAVRSLLVV